MADDVDPRFDPEFQRGYDPAVHGRRPAPASDASPDSWADDADLPGRRNPFVVALPILGGVLLAIAVGLTVRYVLSFNQFGSGIGTRDDNFWITMASSLLPALLTGGLLSFAVWLTLLALTPRVRRE